MKAFLILIIAILALSASGCAGEQTGEGTTAQSPAQITQQPAASPAAHDATVATTPPEKSSAAEEKTNIVSLPEELYVTCVSTYSKPQCYDFAVKERTELKIEVMTESGDFDLGIRYRDKPEFVFEQRAFALGEDTDEITLEPGDYRVIINQSYHYGSYHITGSPATQTSEYPRDSAASATGTPPLSTANQTDAATMQAFIDALTKDKTVNLPEELYVINYSAYSKELRYDFIVKERMEFTVEVTTDSGEFSLGIKYKDTPEYVFEQRAFALGDDTDQITLEPGSYSVVINQAYHYGSYRVTGVTK